MVADPHLEDKFQLIGVAISLVFYGINACLLVQLLPASGRAKPWTNITTFVTFMSASTFLALISYTTIVGSVDHCNAPGGPVAWLDSWELTNIWLAVRSTALFTTWVLDSCMLYQCFMVYSIRKMELWIIGLPTLFLISSFGSGVYLIAVTTAESHLRVLPHFPLCLSTKLIMTSLIAAKLLRQRKKSREDLVTNGEEVTRPYTSLIHVLIQSYALHSGISALFLGLYITNNSAWRIFLPNSVQAALTSHLLVRFQVMRNQRNKSSSVKEEIGSIHFSGVDSRIVDANSSQLGDV